MKGPKVYICILNWKAAHETLKCLESVLECCPGEEVIVLDNGSGDGSLEIIAKYLAGKGERYLKIGEEQVTKARCSSSRKDEGGTKRRIVLIQNRGNYGYAGGNNIGIRWALLQEVCDYVWIINNDVLIDFETLPSLLSVAEAREDVGFVGSVIRYLEAPLMIQCYGGGKVMPLLGKTRLYMKNRPIDQLSSADEREIDYVMGASLLVRRNVLDDIGLMDESYFMYSEEVDWQYRAKAKGWGIAVSSSSFVYHGDSSSNSVKSYLFHYYRNRAAIMFTRKFYGLLPSIIAAANLGCITILQNWKNVKRVIYGIKGVIHGLMRRTSVPT